MSSTSLLRRGVTAVKKQRIKNSHCPGSASASLPDCVVFAAWRGKSGSPSPVVSVDWAEEAVGKNTAHTLAARCAGDGQQPDCANLEPDSDPAGKAQPLPFGGSRPLPPVPQASPCPGEWPEPVYEGVGSEHLYEEIDDFPVSEPAGGSLVSEPVHDEVSPEPVYENLASEPVHDEVSPEPVYENLASEPVHDEVSLEPVYENLVSEPVHDEVSLEPVYENLVSEPVHDEVSTEPVYENLVSEPVHDEVSPEPVYENVASGPIGKGPPGPQDDVGNRASPQQFSSRPDRNLAATPVQRTTDSGQARGPQQQDRKNRPSSEEDWLESTRL